MIILAFLQNLWVKDPARWTELLNKHESRRVGIIRHLLLDYGCLTGRRIKTCFPDLLDQIVFEEASRVIAGDSKTVCPPDTKHISNCLEKYQPDVVLTFGKVALSAVAPLWSGKLIACPHPAARQVDTVAKLQCAAKQLREI